MEENKIYENDIELCIEQFCIDKRIDDLKHESQNVWNGCLAYINKRIFRNNPHLLKHPNGYYKADAMLELCLYYVSEMCSVYDKEVSIIGFSLLTGIETSTINHWNESGAMERWTDGSQKELSNAHHLVYKILNEFREESLKSKLISGKTNPVGTLAVLNHFYDWNMPGVRDNKKEVVLISRNEIENALENNRSTAAIEPPKL